MRVRSSPPVRSRRAFRSSLKSSLVLEKKNTSAERTQRKASPPPLSAATVTALAALDYAAIHMDPIISSAACSSSTAAVSMEEERVVTKKKIPKQITVANASNDTPSEEICKHSMEEDIEIEFEERDTCCLFCNMSLAGLSEEASNEHLKECVAIVKTQRSQRSQRSQLTQPSQRSVEVSICAEESRRRSQQDYDEGTQCDEAENEGNHEEAGDFAECIVCGLCLKKKRTF